MFFVSEVSKSYTTPHPTRSATRQPHVNSTHQSSVDYLADDEGFVKDSLLSDDPFFYRLVPGADDLFTSGDADDASGFPLFDNEVLPPPIEALEGAERVKRRKGKKWKKRRVQKKKLHSAAHRALHEQAMMLADEATADSDEETRIRLETKFQCSRMVCQNEGRCGYDYNIKRARCLCELGYTGEYCEQGTC